MTVMGPDGLQHIPAELPVQAMRTFSIRAPLTTHFRKATCEEANCQHYLEGWRSIVPADSPQADYIRRGSGRRFTEGRNSPGLAEFTFEPGQDCFASDTHRVAIDRPEIFVMRDGDWRGNPTGRSMRLPAQSWVDAFGENLETVRDQHERG